MANIKLITVHGLEVYAVVVNGIVLSTFMSEGAAYNKAAALNAYINS